MDSVHLHLLITHVPVLATIFSFLVFVWGMIQSDKKYYHLAMVGFIAAGILSIVALQSGEGAEEAVEHLAGVSESVIHTHQESAEVTNWIAILLGVASIGGFLIEKYKPSLTKAYMVIILLLGLVSSGSFTYTAYLGGQVRHSEIRTQSAANQTEQGTESEEHEEGELP